MDLFWLGNVKNLYLETFYSVEIFNYNSSQKNQILKKKKAEMQKLPRRRKI